MNEQIEPAMSREQWGSALETGEVEIEGKSVALLSPEVESEPRHLHALAARALHGQPFGFTHADVKSLREMAEAMAAIAQTARTDVSGELRKINSIAGRIEALLPPNLELVRSEAPDDSPPKPAP
jgi:hypothetical protein